MKAAAEEGNLQTLSGAEGDLQSFFLHFPDDPRLAEMQEFQDELDLVRLQKNFERRAGRVGGTDSISPVERAYMEAVRLAASDPDAALARFQALVDVYGSAKEIGTKPLRQHTNQQCIDLARKQIERLQSANEKTNAEQRKLIQEQLARAARLQKTDSAAAEKIYRGLVELYGNKPWAADLVKQARAPNSAGEKDP